MNTTYELIKKLRNISMPVVAKLFAYLVNFVALVFLIRYLGNTLYGRFTIAQTFIEFFTIALGPGFTIIFLRDGGRNKEKVTPLLGNLLWMRVPLAILVYGFIILFAKLLKYPPELLNLIYILAFWIILNGFTDQIRALFYIYQNLYIEAFFLAGESTLRAITIFLVIHFGLGLETLTTLFVIGATIILIVSTVVGTKKYIVKKLEAHPEFWKKIFTAALPFAAIGIIGRLYFKIDIILLSKFCGESITGLYGAAYKFLDTAVGFYGIIVSATLPMFSEYYQKKDIELNRLSHALIKLFLIVAVPIVITMILYSQKIVVFLYGTKFREAGIYLAILSPSLIVTFFNSILGTVLYAIGKQNLIAINSAFCLCFNVIINFALIPHYGAVGAAITTFGTEILLFLFNMIYVSKYVYKESFIKGMTQLFVHNGGGLASKGE